MFDSLWPLVTAAIALLTPCEDSASDKRAQCKPRLLSSVVNATEAELLIAAGERAALDQGGWDTKRHAYVRTRDLGLSTVLRQDFAEKRVLTGVVKRALHMSIFPALVKHCNAREIQLIVADSFMIRYDSDDSGIQEDGGAPQPGLERHKDAYKYSATIVLSLGDRTGVALPNKQNRQNSTESRIDSNDVGCDATCKGDTCDAWVRRSGYTCSMLEAQWNCDCGFCRECLPEIQNVSGQRTAHFQNGGTRFPTAGNATFYPGLGHAIIHGGRLTHAADPITSGRRYILAFFFDEAACQGADVVERYSLLAVDSLAAHLHSMRGVLLNSTTKASGIFFPVLKAIFLFLGVLATTYFIRLCYNIGLRGAKEKSN